MTMRKISDGNPDGNTLGQSATDKTGDHGVVSAQIANISVVTGSYTNSVTATFDSIVTAVNACIGAMTNKGTVAAS